MNYEKTLFFEMHWPHYLLGTTPPCLVWRDNKAASSGMVCLIFAAGLGNMSVQFFQLLNNLKII